MEHKQYIPTIELLNCSKLLTKKTTDDQKIAGLMVLPYILNKESSKDAYEYVFKRMDWGFVKRIFVSGFKNIDNGSDNTSLAEKGSQYLHIASSIIALFLCNGKEDTVDLVIQNLCCALMVKSIDKILNIAEDWLENTIKVLQSGIFLN
ncbi:hypothetical protein BB561_004877 [Smittium simulii]|uniref:Uncharacterized protein n=1 Tax=Smittium simulii TaxID=133385 RepID=A0A2T9YDT7_9FUNG|nr:hypothetical protein BB561_004877 [Smittium simulii]